MPVSLNSTGRLSPIERPLSSATSSCNAMVSTVRSSGEPAMGSTSTRSNASVLAPSSCSADPSISASPARMVLPDPPREVRWRARPGSRPPAPKPAGDVITKSPVNDSSMILLNDAFVDAAKIVMNDTSPTPIISAGAVAAVRFAAHGVLACES